MHDAWRFASAGPYSKAGEIVILRRFYRQVIFPRLCDLALDRPAVARRRRELLADTAGRVLEIGVGTGLNLPHYPPAVRRLATVEPNEGMQRRAVERARQSGIELDARTLSSEQLPFSAGEFDCVVSTFTLCSIGPVAEALAEVWRVLKPGGRFFFLEHGLSPDAGVQKWQRRLNWLEMRLADGCRLDRDIRALVASQPYAQIDADSSYLEGVPWTHGYLTRGQALKGNG